MKAGQFLHDYLQDFARITLSDDRGGIFYEGDVISVPKELLRGLEVVKIEGLGSQNDIIIETKRINPKG